MKGTLNEKEFHPAAESARVYLNRILCDPAKAAKIQESLASCSIDGNRMAEICSETLHRAMTGQMVSDRYLLGLAWCVRDMEESDGK